MANRYLRASGNWNGSVWAATSDGAAGSASTPGVGDTVYIYSNYTLTVNEDVHISGLHQTNGVVNFGSHSFKVPYIESSGSTSRTLNLNSANIRLTAGGAVLTFSGSNLNLVPGTSTIEILAADATIATGSKTFNDFKIDLLGPGANVNITGSPTFRSLIIQSKNSAAHTVTFSDNVNTQKFIAIGSSSSNRLTLQSNDTDFARNIEPGWDGSKYTGSVYGQNLAIGEIDLAYGEVSWGYVGANSISLGSGTGWTFQDPPKISTLVDPLIGPISGAVPPMPTTGEATNPNWTATGAITQSSIGAGGGGYTLGSSASVSSIDTFDFTEDSLVLEGVTPTGDMAFEFEGIQNYSGAHGSGKTRFSIRMGSEQQNSYVYIEGVSEDVAGAGYSWGSGADRAYRYIRLRVLPSRRIIFEYSLDGVSWSELLQDFCSSFDTPGWVYPIPEMYLSEVDYLALKSSRVSIRHIYGSNPVLGSINILPEPPAPTSQGNFLPFFLGA